MGCFCTSKSGADFDFSADTERIDALIADCLYRVRTDDLPVIVLVNFD